MVDQTDFLDLYRKLRLDADCTLAEFKQAYRRHVALWHPDRRRGTRADVLAAARLQRLTVQYSAAMDFYKQHGRLPGAPAASRGGAVVPDAGPRPAARDDDRRAGRNDGYRTEPVSATMPGAQAQRHARTPRWKTAVAAVVLAAVAWSLVPVISAPEDAAGIVALPTAKANPLGSQAAGDIAPGLLPGMTEDEVIALEGEPTLRGQDHWEYGPSWVQFDGGAVSEWHSSPLRPLRIASRRAHP